MKVVEWDLFDLLSNVQVLAFCNGGQDGLDVLLVFDVFAELVRKALSWLDRTLHGAIPRRRHLTPAPANAERNGENVQENVKFRKMTTYGSWTSINQSTKMLKIMIMENYILL